MAYDFLRAQPHPETNETACTLLTPDASPLPPASDRPALQCGGAYHGGRFHLAAVFTDAPDAVTLLDGDAWNRLSEGKTLPMGAPVRKVALFCHGGRLMMSVHTADALTILDTAGEALARLPIHAREAAVCCLGDRCFLSADGAVTPLDGAWQPQGQARPIRAGSTADGDYPPARRDALEAEGRDVPGGHGMLFAVDGAVYWACGDPFRRCAMDNTDTFLCRADGWEGPFSRRFLAIPNGGDAAFFTDGAGRLYAAFVGQAPHSAVYGRAAVLPMARTADGVIRPEGRFITETLPGASMQPLDVCGEIRDSFVYACDDGWYYLTGTTRRAGGTYWRWTGGIRLWRSRDLRAFEDLGVVYDYAARPDAWQRRVSRACNTWAPEIVRHGGTFWITYSTAPGCGLLRSVTGSPQGPYEDMGRVVMRGIDSGFFAEDGALYLVWQNGMLARFNRDCTSFEEEPVLLLPTDGRQVGYEGAGIIRYRGKYLLYAAEWNGDERIDGTYDMMVSVADSLRGPYSPRRVLVPHGGHGSLFVDRQGRLCFSMFGNDRTASFCHGVAVGVLDEDRLPL